MTATESSVAAQLPEKRVLDLDEETVQESQPSAKRAKKVVVKLQGNFNNVAPEANCVYINSRNEIRRVSSDAIINKARGKNCAGRPVGSCEQDTDAKLKLFCHANSQDTLIIITTDGLFFAASAARFPASKVKGKNGNHPYDPLLPELEGSKVATVVAIDDEDAWENKQIIIGTAKGFVCRAKLSEYKVSHKRGVPGKAMKVKEDDVVKYCAVVNPDDSVMFCSSKGYVSNIPVELIRLSGKGSMGNRCKLFDRIADDATQDICMTVCPFVAQCKASKKEMGAKKDAKINAWSLFRSEQSKISGEKDEAAKGAGGAFKRLADLWKAKTEEEKAVYDAKAKAIMAERAEKAKQEGGKADGEAEEEDAKEEEEKEGDDDEGDVKSLSGQPCVVFCSSKGKGALIPVSKFSYTKHTQKGWGGPKFTDVEDGIVALACVTPTFDTTGKAEKHGFGKWFVEPENKGAIDKFLATLSSSEPGKNDYFQRLASVRKALWDPLPLEVKQKYDIAGKPKEPTSAFHRWFDANKDAMAEKLAAMDANLTLIAKKKLLRKDVFDPLPVEEKAKYEIKGEDVPKAGEDGMEVDSEKQALNAPQEELWLATEKDHTHRIKLSSIWVAKNARPKMDSRRLAKLAPEDRLLFASVGTVRSQRAPGPKDVTTTEAPREAIDLADEDEDEDEEEEEEEEEEES